MQLKTRHQNWSVESRMSFCFVSSCKNSLCWYVKNMLVVIFHIIFCSCNRQLFKNHFFSSKIYKGCLSYYSFKIKLQDVRNLIIYFSSASLLFIPILKWKTFMNVAHFFFFFSSLPRGLLHHSVFCEIHKEKVICLFALASHPWQKLYGIWWLKHKITHLLDKNQKGWCQLRQQKAALKDNIKIPVTECSASVADPLVILSQVSN